MQRVQSLFHFWLKLSYNFYSELLLILDSTCCKKTRIKCFTWQRFPVPRCLPQAGFWINFCFHLGCSKKLLLSRFFHTKITSPVSQEVLALSVVQAGCIYTNTKHLGYEHRRDDPLYSQVLGVYMPTPNTLGYEDSRPLQSQVLGVSMPTPNTWDMKSTVYRWDT